MELNLISASGGFLYVLTDVCNGPDCEQRQVPGAHGVRLLSTLSPLILNSKQEVPRLIWGWVIISVTIFFLKVLVSLPPAISTVDTVLFVRA
jgi:hypothetical protein